MADEPSIGLGQAVYDDEGNRLGTVRGYIDDGFVVTGRVDAGQYSLAHEHTPHDFGEAELLWRCSDCGELGDIDEVPDSCPSCGAPAESIYWWTED